MALINCPECGTQVSDKAESCPKCSFPINSKTEKIAKREEGCFLQTLNIGCVIILALITSIVILFIIFGIAL